MDNIIPHPIKKVKSSLLHNKGSSRRPQGIVGTRITSQMVRQSRAVLNLCCVVTRRKRRRIFIFSSLDAIKPLIMRGFLRAILHKVSRKRHHHKPQIPARIRRAQDRNPTHLPMRQGQACRGIFSSIRHLPHHARILPNNPKQVKESSDPWKTTASP